MRPSSRPSGTHNTLSMTYASSVSLISENCLNICMIMLQTAMRKFRMNKYTKSEANLTKITEPKEAVMIEKSVAKVKNCDDLESVRRTEKQTDECKRSQNFSRQRIVSCPESDDLRNLSTGFDSTIFDLKRICEEGLQLKHW